MSESIAADVVAERVSALVGQRAWSPSIGLGSFLTIEFGEARPHTLTASTRRSEATAAGAPRVHGAWHLWLYCCAWRLDEADKMLIASEDAHGTLGQSVSGIDGRTVTSATLTDPIGCGLQIEFGEGLRLTSFALFAHDFEHWHLYCPDGTVVTAGPGSTYTRERSADHP